MGVHTFGRGSLQSSDRPQESLITLRVQFNDLNGVAADPVSPMVRISKDGVGVNVESINAAMNPDFTYPLSAFVPAVPGLWQFSFLTSRLQPALYTVEFGGTFTDDFAVNHFVIVPGQFQLTEITILQDLINRVRFSLMDDQVMVREYRLDKPIPQWTPEHIFTYLREAVSQINSTGPRITGYGVDQVPPTIDHLVVDGARYRALYARGRFEIANEMDYSDQHTLSIKRGPAYIQLAQRLEDSFLKAVESWKKASPPEPIGLKSQRLPFRATRVLGLLGGSSNYFCS